MHKRCKMYLKKPTLNNSGNDFSIDYQWWFKLTAKVILIELCMLIWNMVPELFFFFVA